ncbi:MAG: hypothetical protein GEV06_19775 [Luteitalea sp.]|nr:hypothetical protein [Luteitalea sp.]
MAGAQRKYLQWMGLRGRDGSTSAPIQIPDYKVKEALNVDFFRASFARKRGGAASVSLSSAGLTGIVSAGARHVPSASETAAEMWLVDDAATPVIARNAAGTWSNPTWKDNITSRPQDVWFVSFNGKLHIFGDTAQDRYQIFDPAISTSALRRAGLDPPTGFTSGDIANTGSGTYAATARWYKQRYTVQVGGTTVLRSEATDAVMFTPSGTGTAARVTKADALNEGETHWELYGAAAEAGPFFLLATTVVGTTITDDSADPSGYSSGDLEPTAGDYTTPSSFKYAIADNNRMLWAGGWESGTPPNTVFFSPVLGTTSAGYYDDERLPTDNEIPFNERDGGFITGFGGPIENMVLVLKNNQTWRLIPTGIEADPYRRKLVSEVVGSIRQQTVVKGEDDAGRPIVAWISAQGPVRYSPVYGLQKIVWDVQDIWDTVNLAASTVVGHGVRHADKHQIWWWLSTGANNEPNVKIVFDERLGRVIEAGVVRDGWAQHTGESAKARCSFMFSNTIGATMSRDLKPYIGQHGAVTRLWKCDTADTDDAGTAFQAYVELPDRHFGQLHHLCQTDNPIVLGSVGSHTLRASFIRDYGAETRTADVTMSAVSDAETETRIAKAIEAGFTADAKAVAIRIGDASAVASAWTIDAISLPYEQREPVVV